MASLSNTLLMIPRELPSYLKVAYSLRYANEQNTGNFLARITTVAQRIFALIKELIYYRPTLGDFDTNRKKLKEDFEVINQTVSKNQKPLCVYFVSAQDHNGAILGNQLYYYHHYKIQGLQKHFAVAPKLVSSQDEMKTFMTSIRQQHKGREIKFVDVVSHGSKSSLGIDTLNKSSINAKRLRDDLFSDCAPDATILLDACFTGLGDKNIADEIARKTPGRKILAPGPSMYFSKPVVRVRKNQPQVVSAVHGFAIFNAYVCKSFSYAASKPTQYPYVKDKSLQKDITLIAHSSILRSAWFDRFVGEDREDFRNQIITIYNQLSQETKALVIKKICENQKLLTQAEGETFLRNCPLDYNVRSAFRSIFDELTYEVREYSTVKWAKLFLSIQNVVEVIQAGFRTLTCRQAIAPIQHLAKPLSI
ncbi:MAG: hypothetical protein H7A37_05700 [Chlamydiales bacterium]|nr:hypothetical protein [Chlamydiales bacterium]